MQDSPAESVHAAAVDTWLARALTNGSAVEVVTLFRHALEALWLRAVTTLGTVTLTAIAERVLYTATAKYRFLSAINPRPNGDVRWKQQLVERLCNVPREELLDGLRFTLIDLLTVLGRLTAEILTHDLHATLLEVGLTAPARALVNEPERASSADRDASSEKVQS